MQSFLSNAFAVYQKGLEKIQATLEEIVSADRSRARRCCRAQRAS